MTNKNITCWRHATNAGVYFLNIVPVGQCRHKDHHIIAYVCSQRSGLAHELPKQVFCPKGQATRRHNSTGNFLSPLRGHASKTPHVWKNKRMFWNYSTGNFALECFAVLGRSSEHWISHASHWTRSWSFQVTEMALFSIILESLKNHTQNQCMKSRLSFNPLWTLVFCRLTGHYMLIFMPGIPMTFAFWPVLKYMLNQVCTRICRASSCHLNNRNSWGTHQPTNARQIAEHLQNFISECCLSDVVFVRHSRDTQCGFALCSCQHLSLRTDVSTHLIAALFQLFVFTAWKLSSQNLLMWEQARTESLHAITWHFSDHSGSAIAQACGYSSFLPLFVGYIYVSKIYKETWHGTPEACMICLAPLWRQKMKVVINLSHHSDRTMHISRLGLGMSFALEAVLQVGSGRTPHDLHWVVVVWDRDFPRRWRTQPT